MRDSRAMGNGNLTGELNWNGHPVYYRAGSSDCEVLYKILLKKGKRAEYRVPPEVSPRTIFDIGANIGAASLLFASLFPDAKIHAFEPVPDNFALLRRNVASYPNIHVHPVALGKKNGRLQMLSSDSLVNFGGYSFYEKGSSTSRTIDVEMRTPRGMLEELGIPNVDLIKVDTEGSEYDIITAFDEPVLSETRWITGELHGEKDFELLAFLSRWFDLDMKKTLHKRLFNFSGCNKNFTPEIKSW
ncbi:MAG: FkbM family methyltransferase [Gammaproteobacteria bacterium]|nr:FkbM family methyltransferase [Gammaproteobacteria bacterium]